MRVVSGKQRFLLTGLAGIVAVSFSAMLAASTSPPLAQGKSGTSTTLSSSLNPSTFGILLTFTASVHSKHGKSPEGVVTFKDGGITLGTGNLNSSGQATFSTPLLPAGLHLISATYGADRNPPESSSSTLRQLIKRASTLTNLRAPSASVFGQPVTLTASVFTKDAAPTAGPPAGIVTFKDGKSVLGGVTLNMFQQATFSTSRLSAGPHFITASYEGNSDFEGSASTASSLKVSEKK